MVQSKLFILKQEIELLWTVMHYEREVNPSGKPTSKVEGGQITVCFATRGDTDLVLRWMTKPSLDDTSRELDRMEKGKICFYADGFDYPPTRTYEFDDTFPVFYKEVFDTSGEEPLQTVMTISPAIQNYGADLIKPWNVSYVPPVEKSPHQSEEPEEKKLVDYYLTDSDENVIDEYEVGDKILLHIITENRVGDKITIHLEDRSHDFKYKGNVLEDDKLENYTLKGDHDKIELEVTSQLF